MKKKMFSLTPKFRICIHWNNINSLSRLLFTPPKMSTISIETFDRSKYTENLSVVALRVSNKNLGKTIKSLHGHLLNLPRKKNVVLDMKGIDDNEFSKMKPGEKANKAKIIGNPNSKVILLSQKVKSMDLSELPAEVAQFAIEQSIERINYEIKLDYSYWSVEHVLAKILPEGIDIPSSFETIGHIAHLNLRDPHLPYRYIIGQVFLDKNQPNIKTVVNKTSTIETKFRTFPMEVIAGENNMEVQVHESKSTFQFNYAEVYWNSRLQQEHLRVIRLIEPSEIVCDMMCGIGPFAIPLAKKGCTVFANDLNPKSYLYLKKNMSLNKVSKNVEAFNMDGREFVHSLINAGKFFNHVIMNLPASALDFLDAFVGKFDSWEGELPIIHCYCFSSAEDIKADVQERAEKIIGGSISDSIIHIEHVRDVAPKKIMMCLSFRLPKHVAFSDDHLEALCSKRRKIC